MVVTGHAMLQCGTASKADLLYPSIRSPAVCKEGRNGGCASQLSITVTKYLRKTTYRKSMVSESQSMVSWLQSRSITVGGDGDEAAHLTAARMQTERP